MINTIWRKTSHKTTEYAPAVHEVRHSEHACSIPMQLAVVFGYIFVPWVRTHECAYFVDTRVMQGGSEKSASRVLFKKRALNLTDVAVIWFEIFHQVFHTSLTLGRNLMQNLALYSSGKCVPQACHVRGRGRVIGSGICLILFPILWREGTYLRPFVWIPVLGRCSASMC